MRDQLELARNCIICPTPGHWLVGPHRILEIDPISGQASLFRMRRPLTRPRWQSWQQLYDDWVAGLLSVELFTPPNAMLLADRDLPETYRNHRDKWWQLFDPILGESRHRQLLQYPRETIGQFIAETGLPVKTVYRGIYRYFYYGCIPNAFLPRFELRGGSGKERLGGTKKLGRPRESVRLGHAPLSTGHLVSEQDRANILWAMETYWSCGKQYTFKRSHEAMCVARYSERVGDKLKLVTDRPSLGQFIYNAKKLTQFATLLRRRIGEKKWDRNFRAITGKSSAEVLGPADRYQIDATVADIYLTSIYNRNWIIGRPVIYVVVDVFSGYIVGLYIGLEGPSWEGARLALLNAFTDKKEFLRSYGFGGDTEWSAHHMPVHVFADRAELLSKNAQGLVTGLGVTIDIASGYRPDWKGIVERKFGIANDTIIHFLPGAVLKRNRDRGERDYALDGTLNLHEFTSIIIRSFLHFNKYHQYKERCTPAMIEAGVSPTPIGLWTFGMDHLVGGTPYRSQEEIYAHLLPQGSARVHEDGIHFKGLRYTSRYALEQQWFERARYNKRFRIDVRYHMETPGRIWIIGSPTKGVRPQAHEATLLDPYKRYETARWEEALDLLAFEGLQRRDEDDHALEARINQIEEDDSVICQAKRDLKSTYAPSSASQRKAGIKMHRHNERVAQRKVQAAHDMASYSESHASDSSEIDLPMKTNAPISITDALIWRTLGGKKEVP